MLFNKYQKLTNISDEITEWSVIVRAQSIWDGINRTTLEFRGLNVILIDDEVSIPPFLSVLYKG